MAAAARAWERAQPSSCASALPGDRSHLAVRSTRSRTSGVTHSYVCSWCVVRERALRPSLPSGRVWRLCALRPFHFTGVGAFPARSKHTQLGRGGRAQVGRAFAMRRGTHSSGAGARARAGLYIRHTQGARSEAALSAPRPCRGGRPASPRGLQVKAGAATSGRVSRVWGPRVAMGRSVGPWETWEALLATRGRPYSFRLRTASPLIQKRGSWGSWRV